MKDLGEQNQNAGKEKAELNGRKCCLCRRTSCWFGLGMWETVRTVTTLSWRRPRSKDTQCEF